MACLIFAFPLLFVSRIHSLSADEDTEANYVKQMILEPDGQMNVPSRKNSEDTLSPNEKINLNKEYLIRLRRDLEEDIINPKQCDTIFGNKYSERGYRLSAQKNRRHSQFMKNYWKRIKDSGNTQRFTKQGNAMKKLWKKIKRSNLTYEEYFEKLKQKCRTLDETGIEKRKQMSEKVGVKSDAIDLKQNITMENYWKLRYRLSKKKNPLHSLRMRNYWQRIRESGNTQRITDQRIGMKNFWKKIKQHNETHEEFIEKLRQGWRTRDENGIDQREHMSETVKDYWRGVKSDSRKYRELKKKISDGWRKKNRDGIDRREEQKEKLKNYWSRIKNESNTERLNELRDIFRELWKKRKERKRNNAIRQSDIKKE
uniref:Uncharacterized protein n=1 Tax=Cacopsylla melanoneura TaxID=428564 RepID=A0A8D8XDX3_9HEMI